MSLTSPLGSFIPGNSPLHRLDPRAKAIALLVLVVSVFTVSSPVQLACAVALVCLGCLAAGRAGAHVPRAAAVIVPFAAIVAIFDLFVLRGGATLAQLGPLTVTEAGTWGAMLYSVRLVLAVALGALLLVTTTPTALTDAFESLLSPLDRLGVPIHEAAMVLSLALRFVPTLSDEVSSVMDAQAARGASFETGGIVARGRALGSVMVPVFAGALRHAQNLSRALDARCYEGGSARTHYRELSLGRRDAALAVVCLAWACLLVWLHLAGL